MPDPIIRLNTALEGRYRIVLVASLLNSQPRCLLALSLLLLPADLASQVSQESDVQDAIEAIRERGDPSRAVAVLTRRGRVTPNETLDAVADSLVALALDDQEQRVSHAAVTALVLSALPGNDKVPYPRAFEALVRIIDHRRSLRSSA